jgi:DNA-binding response OmpR family regulator
MGDVVLIADDDADIVRFVALNLRLEGLDAVAVRDGREAVRGQVLMSLLVRAHV